MGSPRIALLNAAHKADMTEENFRRELGADADVVEFHCPSGELPERSDFDGFVITGSSASVYWDREWIADLEAWSRNAVDAGLPGFGVCFGHQLLAAALGGTVEGMSEYEIGYRTVNHDGQNRLLDGVDDDFTVFTTHSDRVADPPPGATVFARNDYGVQGFHKGGAFGVQFHPEYDMETAETIARGKDGQLSPARIEAVLDGIHEENYRAARAATRVFDNFLAYVSDSEQVPAE